MQRKPKKLNAEALWNYALVALGRRAHSVGELRQKLARRTESAEILEATMTKLQEYGLADDNKFSEAFSSARLQGQGFGKMRVFRELRTKRVSSNIAERAVEKTYTGTSETELIENYLNRKFRGKNLYEFLKEDKYRASVYRRLRTAGFSSSGSFAIIKKYAGAVEEFEDTEDSEQ